MKLRNKYFKQWLAHKMKTGNAPRFVLKCLAGGIPDEIPAPSIGTKIGSGFEVRWASMPGFTLDFFPFSKGLIECLEDVPARIVAECKDGRRFVVHSKRGLQQLWEREVFLRDEERRRHPLVVVAANDYVDVMKTAFVNAPSRWTL